MKPYKIIFIEFFKASAVDSGGMLRNARTPRNRGVFTDAEKTYYESSFEVSHKILR